MSTTNHECLMFEDDLAAVIDGEPEALARHVAHLAGCDECRDARHDARIVARAVGRAGDGIATDERFIAGLLAAVDAGPAMARTGIERRDREPRRGAPHGASLAPASLAVPAPGRFETSIAPPRPSPRVAAEPSRVRPAPVRLLRPVLAAVAVAACLLVGVGVASFLFPRPAPIARVPRGILTARLDRIVRAGPAGAGVEVRAARADRFAPAGEGARVLPGEIVRTDRYTRARLALSDGSSLVLDRNTELTLDSGASRRLRLDRGVVLADVAHLEKGPRATLATPEGVVEVLGTKFVLTAAEDSTHVDVLRGVVRLASSGGAAAEVRAGQEARLDRGAGVVRVSATASRATELRWSELEPEGGPEVGEASGLGVLRARRPGERDARERPLSLARHDVSVRIAGNVARTEVEEVFANEGPDVLEGTYEFPVPAGARIVRLALEVEGRLVEGAVVERDRGTKIMAGVVRNATPVAARKPKTEEEWIWVPGPWRDPALLEWRAGGRFALRIYPIPAHGSRRVILGYEELVPRRGDGRRWVYPLPQIVGPTAAAGRFQIEARVSGADPSRPVVVHGYPGEVARSGGGATVRFQKDGFVPAGDFVLDWSTPDPRAELSTWTYRKPDEARGWAMLALRPELPAWTESRAQDLAIVVDSSHSMRGERWDRAAALAARLVREMDRRDRFVLLACDTGCREMPGGARAASAEAAHEVQAWLQGIRPAGSTNLLGTLRAAVGALAAGRDADRIARVLYLGDGIGTVGLRRLGAVEAEVASLAQGAILSTVAIGGDADQQALGSVARAGRGQLVVWRAGETLATAALAVLETTQGTALEDPSLELPAGLEDVAPRRLPTLRAGEELVVGARLAGPVRGEVVLRGKIAGAPFERRWPIDVAPEAAAGNAFVPAVWAERQIAEIERADAPDAADRIVALSRQYGVLSRHTSLIVLETEAMFRAFDVAHTTPMASWSGEEDPVATHSAGLAEPDDVPGDPIAGLPSAMGSDAHDALGALMGDQVGENFGYGGLGLRGTGRGGGGGGIGEGTIGLGNMSTIGRGAGPGHGAGYGRGAGGLRGRTSSVPTVRAGTAQVHGSLSKEVIRRVVRSHMNEVRFCYEAQLAGRPGLDGRVSVTFVISPSGAVQGANVVSSTLGNDAVDACLTRAIRRWAFPAPEGGGTIVVTYPFTFQAAGGETAPAAPPPSLEPPPGMPGPAGRPLGNGRWVRRTRVRTWERVATIAADTAARPAERRAVVAAEAALAERPDSRDRHRDLVRALARAGEVERALTLAAAWVDKDPLDTEGIAALADALARESRRDEALRMLSGAVDATPGDAGLHERLASVFDRLGASDFACAHRESVAELSPTDPVAVGAAVRCERALGRGDGARRLLARVTDPLVRARAEEEAARIVRAPGATGDLVVEARWEGGADLDLAVVGPKGVRSAWLGVRRGVEALDATSTDHERLALRRLPVGGFTVEIARSIPPASGSGILRGQLEIRALGQRRVVPFVLDTARATVARVDVRQQEVVTPLF